MTNKKVISELHAAIIRLAYAERSIRSSLVSNSFVDVQIRESILGMIEASKEIRNIYKEILEENDEDIDEDLKTRPEYTK